MKHTTAPGELTVDVREVLARGESPCGPIDAAVHQLRPGQVLVVLAPFEPLPLYTKLGMCGFGHETNQLEDGTWRVVFRPEGDADPGSFQVCRESDH
jgi:uncharacterized protein (DUF2249 family)